MIHKLIAEALKSRPGHWPTKVFAGRNAVVDGPSAVILFSVNPPRHYMVEPNEPGADSVLLWDDGGYTVMRTAEEPQFDVAPDVLGLAARPKHGSLIGNQGG